MKDPRSLLLILLSAGLIVTWGYHIYDKSNYVNQVKEVLVVDTAALNVAISDSLKKIKSRMQYDQASENSQADSANKNREAEIVQELQEIDRIQAEVDGILNRKNLTGADITGIKNKISELQKRINKLRSENAAITAERKKGNDTLTPKNGIVNSFGQSLEKASRQNKVLESKMYEVATFKAAEVKLIAFAGGPNQKKIETTERSKAEIFVGSFAIQNNVASFANAEVMIVITDPSGKTMYTIIGDAGSFDSRREGRKMYSRKIKFEYRKKEKKRITFTMEPDIFQKGDYNFSIYHNGVRIGKTICRLS